MNPALYKLPLKRRDGWSTVVMDAFGKDVAWFFIGEQADDFIAEMNKHAPKQPCRPRELWAIWCETPEVFFGRDGIAAVYDSESMARGVHLPSGYRYRVVRFDTLPVTGEP